MSKKSLPTPVEFTPKYNQSDVEIIKEEALYNGFFKMKKVTLKHRLFNGGWSGNIEREMMVRGDAVCVLLYDPRKDKVLLIEQFRACAVKHVSPWLLELVAGMVEDGESNEEVARRESLEEAGVEVLRLEWMLNFVPSPGGLVEYLKMYVGEFDSNKVNLEKSYGLQGENEDIRLHLFDADVAIALLKTNIDNASTIMGLQWLALNKQDLRARWLA
ncbi:NUDIX domain-containing protein [Marinomonas sp. 15G1-11]|uniref:ADP-ribose pyrophosphatase n=1 Tax=Marinomonas phaeophyticola TaxID=3004091 RepID=A0ABT4JS57_9GAMM|nr:NUDIX domain-containing protein [Marinomonas sp. 15G1-11]MCZ2721227.1 NUDIX domain-containing protein [Marinomonas sp. 15G1-11]